MGDGRTEPRLKDGEWQSNRTETEPCQSTSGLRRRAYLLPNELHRNTSRLCCSSERPISKRNDNAFDFEQ